MSSRFWLALAFVLAFGASPARADSRARSRSLSTKPRSPDLPQGAATLIVGNPMIADVTMLKNNDTMVITGKGFGQTNLIAIDGAGSLIEEQQIRVLPSKNAAGPAERNFQNVLLMQPGLHADRSTWRR